ncbi:MAG: hypothetical protein MHM6MM_007555 [Cercozoa sp. M6MM]
MPLPLASIGKAPDNASKPLRPLCRTEELKTLKIWKDRDIGMLQQQMTAMSQQIQDLQLQLQQERLKQQKLNHQMLQLQSQSEHVAKPATPQLHQSQLESQSEQETEVPSQEKGADFVEKQSKQPKNEILVARNVEPIVISDDDEDEKEILPSLNVVVAKGRPLFLKDTRSAPWKPRHDLLRFLQQHCGLASLTELQEAAEALRDGLCVQLRDLRSAVVRQACATLVALSKKLGSKLDKVSAKVAQALLDRVFSSTKAIAIAAADTLRTLVLVSRSTRVLRLLLRATRDSHAEVRAYAIQLLADVLNATDAADITGGNTDKEKLTAIKEASKKPPRSPMRLPSPVVSTVSSVPALPDAFASAFAAALTSENNNNKDDDNNNQKQSDHATETVESNCDLDLESETEQLGGAILPQVLLLHEIVEAAVALSGDSDPRTRAAARQCFLSVQRFGKIVEGRDFDARAMSATYARMDNRDKSQFEQALSTATVLPQRRRRSSVSSRGSNGNNNSHRNNNSDDNNNNTNNNSSSNNSNSDNNENDIDSAKPSTDSRIGAAPARANREKENHVAQPRPLRQREQLSKRRRVQSRRGSTRRGRGNLRDFIQKQRRRGTTKTDRFTVEVHAASNQSEEFRVNQRQ